MKEIEVSGYETHKCRNNQFILANGRGNPLAIGRKWMGKVYCSGIVKRIVKGISGCERIFCGKS